MSRRNSYSWEYDRRRRRKTVDSEGERFLALLAWWLWLPLLYGIGWILSRLLSPGMSWNQGWDQWFMANVLSFSTLFWIWLAVWLFFSALILGAEDGSIGIAMLVVVAMIGSLVWGIILGVRNDKDYARFYNAQTVFYTPDLQQLPDSLTRLLEGSSPGDGTRCDIVGGADVPSCIKRGTLPLTGWDARVASQDGAIKVLTRTSGTQQNISLDQQTMTYLSPWNGQPAMWSGVMDGSGYSQPLGGVAEWTGQGNPTQCEFKGKFQINRALAGEKMNSLSNLLAEKYPSLTWHPLDVWGYCNGDEPVVVIPMTQQIYFKSRTVDTAGGVVTVRGHNGDTVLQYFPTVKPGQFPGPVYSQTLTATQRDQSSWAAGRRYHDQDYFGYDPANSAAQSGNVSEYLLRDKATGRLVFVTPLTLHKSTSELFIAYAVSYADEVTSGQLNQMSIYTLGGDDPRLVNIDNLESDALNYLAQNDSTFIPNKGVLVEFTPVDGDIWRGFGELNGRVIYRLDISAHRKVPTQLVSLEAASPANGPVGNGPAQSQPAPGSTACGQSPNTLSPNQLATCITQFATELANRQQPQK